MKIEEIERLYHGSGKWFENIDLKYTKAFKDFGRGFYLTSNLIQAQKWAQKKGERFGKAYIYIYDVSHHLSAGLKILELLQYDAQWVDLIARSRIEGYEPDYDIVYDRMADNQYSGIADILQRYRNHETGWQEVIRQIKWKDFEADQYCFKSEKALLLLQRKMVIVQHRDTSGLWRQEVMS